MAIGELAERAAIEMPEGPDVEGGRGARGLVPGDADNVNADNESRPDPEVAETSLEKRWHSAHF